MPPRTPPPVLLSFCANDPLGSSGVQADVLAAQGLGVHAATVMTGVMVRDTRDISAFWPIEPEWVDEQARVLLEDLRVAAFRVGAVASPMLLAVIAEIVSDYPDVPVVLDPAIGTFPGEGFADDDMLDALRDLLLPQATVVTLDGPEARLLAAEDDDESGALLLPECARRLIDLGAGHVLITGAHEPGPQVINTLFGLQGVLRTDACERLPGSFLGAGDYFAASLAARLARGDALTDAAPAAQLATWARLAAAVPLGMGRWLPQPPADA